MLHNERYNKEIRGIICWHDEKRRRKEHGALCHWMQYIEKEKQGEVQAVVCIEEAGGPAPNQSEKASLIKDI